MVPGYKQEYIIIPYKKSRIYISCATLKKGYHVIADYNGAAVYIDGISKSEAIHDALEQLGKLNHKLI